MSGGDLRVFIAGPLFSQAEREFNLKVDEHLRRHGFETFLPQRDVGKLDELLRKKGRRAYREIFERDLAGVKQADVVVAILDGADVDSGTAFEVGYAFAKGKPVIGLKTDMRVFARDEELNNMLAQAIRALARNLDELVEELRRLG
ncbi:MAG: nucleoside 2-deoxyribosyltransferase [Candidatus Hadarchaeales archaeon]